jgi:hypothetical protein
MVEAFNTWEKLEKEYGQQLYKYVGCRIPVYSGNFGEVLVR